MKGKLTRGAATAFFAITATLCTFAAGVKEAATPAQAAREPEAGAPLRLGALKGPTGVGMIHLFEGGSDMPPGVAFAVEALASADAMAAKLISGDLDAAVLPLNLAAKLYNAGVGYSLLAVVGNGMVRVVATDPGVRSLADFKGRDVHVAGQGATPEFLLRALSRKAGLDPSADFKMVFSMAQSEIAANFVAGRISLAVLPEPFATMALSGRRDGFVPFSLSALWTESTGMKDYPMSVFVASAKAIRDRPLALSAIMREYARSIASVIADPGRAGTLVEKHDLGLKASVVAASVPSSAFVFVEASEARPEIEAMLRVFLESAPASIGGKLPDSGFYARIGR